MVIHIRIGKFVAMKARQQRMIRIYRASCVARTVGLMLALLLCDTVQGQHGSRAWETYLEQTGLTEEMEAADVDALYDALSELEAAPVNLNRATRQDWERMPFLSLRQISDIVEYTDRVGTVHSWGELSAAGVVDAPTLGLLRCFMYLGEGAVEKERHTLSLSDMLRYGKHEVTAYAALPLYTREGDRGAYLGSRYKHWIRYTYRYRQDVKVGLVGAQDAGEPFFKGRNGSGYDYYSFYLQIANRGRLRSLVVGRYRLRIGAGLVMNTGYSFGKLSALTAMNRTAPLLSGHASRSEANYLQGAAATIRVARNIDVTAFVSWRKRDATLAADSMSVATLVSSGYHRTESELRRKNNTGQTVAGGNANYHCGPLHLGVTGVYTALSRPLLPDTRSLYRRNMPQGKSFWNVSADYGYTAPHFSLSGETATGDSHAVATVNMLTVSPTQRLTLSAVQRFYSFRYYALFGRSFGSGSNVNNESGVYVGVQWNMARHLLVKAYTDYAYHAWPHYGMSQPGSHDWDNALSLLYDRKRYSLSLRYRVTLRQEDNESKTDVTDHVTHRLQGIFATQGGALTGKSHLSLAVSGAGGTSVGWMAGQEVAYAHRWLSAAVAATYFHTHDYDSRLYAYERGMQYTMSYPMYYGHGMRMALIVRAEAGHHLMFAVKAGSTHYFDRNHIASGLQMIDGRRKTDVEAQVRVRF